MGVRFLTLDPRLKQMYAPPRRTLTEVRAQAETPNRTDILVETGLEFRPGDPLHVRVVHRDHRTLVTDDGAAIAKAGNPRRWQEVARRVADELVVNISRHGVVSLPVVRVGPPEDQIVHRIGDASLAFYQELLDSAE